MNSSCLTSDDLLEATGYQREGDLKKSLEAQGIPVIEGKGGKFFTTLDLVKAAGLAKIGLTDSEPEKKKEDWI